MRAIVAGGGTGGHITPNIALIEGILKLRPQAEILYIGTKGGMEETMIKEKGWSFQGIYCGKLRRYFSWQNFLDFFKTLAGIWQSFWIIFKFKPEVIFCKGGYVSLPVAVAGGILRKPVIIHESDAEPGLANRLAAWFAHVICVSFEETTHFWKDKKILVTGNPVREDLRRGEASRGWKLTGLKPGKPVVLVMGGSQGSAFINSLIWENLDKLLVEFQIIHLCGKGKQRPDLRNKVGYFSTEFLGEPLKDVLAISRLVISRAGANALVEIEYLGLPAILIPLVEGSRGDQIKNAEIFAKHWPAEIIDERQTRLKNIDLVKLIRKLANAKVGRTKNDAALMIANVMLKYEK